MACHTININQGGSQDFALVGPKICFQNNNQITANQKNCQPKNWQT